MSVTFLTDVDKSELKNDLAKQLLDSMHFEQGSITSSTGELATVDNRLRSIDFIRVRGQEITVPDSYDILGVIYYDDNFVYKTGGTKKTQSVVLDGEYPWAKITVRRTNDDPITPQDIITNLHQFNVNERLSTVELDSMLLENGDINNVSGGPLELTNSVRTVGYLRCVNQTIVTPQHCKIGKAMHYTADKTFLGMQYVNNRSLQLTPREFSKGISVYAKIVFKHIDDTDNNPVNITIDDIKCNVSLEHLKAETDDIKARLDDADIDDPSINVEELSHKIDSVSKSANILSLDSLHFEVGSITSSDGVSSVVNNRLRSIDFIRVRGQEITAPDKYIILGVIYFDDGFNYVTGSVKNTRTVVLDGEYPWAKITVRHEDNIAIVPQDIKTNLHHGTAPLVKFDITRNMLDSAAVTADMKSPFEWSFNRHTKDFEVGNTNVSAELFTTLEQVYTLYDSLVAKYPRLWTRVDLADTLGIPYPEYANGIAVNDTQFFYHKGSFWVCSECGTQHVIKPTTCSNKDCNGTNFLEFGCMRSDMPGYVQPADPNDVLTWAYKPTPAYRTYMYIFSFENVSMLNGTTSANTSRSCAKKKLLLTSGVHGDEKVSPFNSYLFAKRLSEISEEDDYYKFAQAFDVYIVPCVNGYGQYHNTRWNANGVNITRNFDTGYWSPPKANVPGLSSCPGDTTNDNYPGLSAESEFETQLLTKAAEYVAPDIAIDHHNYTATKKWQFYSGVAWREWTPLSYASATDCSIAFKRKYPQYFGKNIELARDTNEAAFEFENTNPVQTTWWRTRGGVYFPALIEVSQEINYKADPCWVCDSCGTAYGTETKPAACTAKDSSNKVCSNTTFTHYDKGQYAVHQPNGAKDDDGKHTRYSPEVFSIAEFTLRNQLLRYGQFVLDNCQ